MKLILLMITVWAMSIGCVNSDTGDCCRVAGDTMSELIPVPDQNGDTTINDIRVEPAFDCEALTCVSYAGSQAYCTESCKDNGDCPKGFTCSVILTSDPGPDSPIQAGDRFCVRVGHQCGN